MPEPAAALLPWTRWTMPSEVTVALTAVLVAYVAGLGPLRPREAKGERLTRREALAFAGGILSLFVVLTGPLADLAGTFLFSAHMVQHLTLSLAAPAHTVFVIPFSVAFFRWVREEADEDDEADSPAGSPPS